jgi:hypothetical protein
VQANTSGDADACLNDIILSDPSGAAMLVESTCGTFSVQDGPVYGCTDSDACNYNSNATDDDGSCEYDSCVGCTDPDALNYNSDATIDDGSCVYNEPEHFMVDLDNTGESSLIIIESANLSVGDEIGLFDLMLMRLLNHVIQTLDAKMLLLEKFLLVQVFGQENSLI